MHSSKNGNPISLNSRDIRSWILASRPKTWTASIAPVCIGHFLTPDLPFQFLPLLFALLLQIGSNFANDYFDFVKGVDTPHRQGPKRALLEGWISKSEMRWAMILVFSLAFLCAIPLMQKVGILSLFFTLFAIACAIFYTAGPKPLAYLGLGEPTVFFFFGPVAVLGTHYLQTFSFDLPSIIWSLPPGLLASAILTANNLRDYPTDQQSGKNTLVVRFGLDFGKKLWIFCMYSALTIPCIATFLWNLPLWQLLPSTLLAIGAPLARQCRRAQTPTDFFPLLPQTSLLLLLYTILFCVAHAFSS